MASAVPAKTPTPRPSPLLGGRVRYLRRRKGLTVEELARAVDVDKAHISRIENNRKTPSIAILVQLAKALDVSTGHLLGETVDKSEIRVFRAAQLGEAGRGVDTGEHRYVPLLHEGGANCFEAFVVYPGRDPGSAQARHAGQEMLYILSGTIEVVFESHAIQVGQGDCIHFPGYLHHRLRRVGRARAAALLVLSNE